MSLKDNINMVKEELSSEEKFFEKAIVTERFIKKYKKPMIALVVMVILFIGVNIAYEINKNTKIRDANIALDSLLLNPKDGDVSNDLKSLSPNLYEVWSFSQAVANKDLTTMKKLENSQAPLIGDLAKYELANSVSSLDEYASTQGAIFKDLALIRSAIMLMNENKIEDAHNKLLKIPKESPLSKTAKALLHYGVK
ncbi:hypothetical protein [Sulfurimonas sp.]|uniref:hypothetical protein n=1 Tax=Sulfurimonas sp. TaxID=2022749 RepID=UPI0025D8D019|nr:hypothetical protein [Sulfurimonas sp.]MDD5156754.1 hypothetical protein [Sulfurimonas sp.]